MKLEHNQLIGLIVETEKGTALGKISGFVFDTLSQSIISYLVRPNNPIKGLVKKELQISRGQVVEINNHKMLVEDQALRDSQQTNNKNKQTKKAPQGATMFK